MDKSLEIEWGPLYTEFDSKHTPITATLKTQVN